MKDTLPLSARIYARLIRFYPEDLRVEYGSEMALVFSDDLEAARREAGLYGAARVWWCALSEFVRLQMPGFMSSPLFRVPAVWFAASAVIMSFEIWMSMAHMPKVPTPFEAICAALLLPAMGTPLAAFASCWVCRGRDVILLDLSPKRREEATPCSKYVN